MDTTKFIEILKALYATGEWKVETSSRLKQPLRLRRINSPTQYCPLTAVYFHLTSKKLPPCFWVPEITEDFDLPWWEVLEIAYAADACNCSRWYDKKLRNNILTAVGLPEEKVD